MWASIANRDAGLHEDAAAGIATTDDVQHAKHTLFLPALWKTFEHIVSCSCLAELLCRFSSHLQTSSAPLVPTTACHRQIALAACRWSGPCSAATQSGTLCLWPASMALHSWHVSVLAGFCALCCLLSRLRSGRSSYQQTCLRHHILLPAECAAMAAFMCGTLHTLRCSVAKVLAHCC